MKKLQKEVVFISLDELLVELYHTENEIDFLKKAQIKDELEEDIKKQLKKKKKIEKMILELCS